MITKFSPVNVLLKMRRALWAALSGAVMLSMFVRANATEPWRQWTQNPLFANLNVQVIASAATNIPVKIILGDITNQVLGTACTNSVTNLLASEVKFYRAYQLTIVSSNLDQLNLDISVKPPVSLVDPKHANGSFPRGFKILLDQQDYSPVSFSNTTNPCGAFSNTWIVEIRKDISPNWRIDDDSNDPDTFAGQGSSLAIGPGKSGSYRDCGIDWNASLGHLLDGNTAGKLRIQEKNITSSIYTPDDLFYTCKSTNVSAQLRFIVTNLSSGALRQVIAPQAFVDIIPATNQYSIAFWYPTNVLSQTNGAGLYTNFVGNPLVKWIVQNPDTSPVGSNRLYVIEQRFANATNGTLAFSGTNILSDDGTNHLWAVTAGTNNEAKIQSRAVVIGAAVSGRTNRVETVIVKNGAGVVAYKCKEEYEQFPWGWELTKTTTDPDGAALVTQFSYYLNDSAAQDGQLQWVIYPDGYWEKRIYKSVESDIIWDPFSPDAYYQEGLLHYILYPWDDAPATPDLADLSNSLIRKYEYDAPSFVPSSLIDAGGYDSSSGTYVRSHVSIFDQDMESEGDYVCRIPRNGLGVNELSWKGERIHAYTPDAPAGIADHPFLTEEFNGQDHSRIYYYDHGTFSAVSNIFTINPTNHLYTSDPSITNYPDRRITVLHLPIFEIFGITPDYYDTIDDHNLASSTWTGLLPFQSWKDVQVMQRGGIVLEEKYVYTGMSNSAPVWERLYQDRHYLDSFERVTNTAHIDSATGSVRTTYVADYRGTNSADGELLLSDSDETGMLTYYSYDSLKRIVVRKQAGVAANGTLAAQADRTATVTFDAAGHVLAQTFSAGSLSQTQTATFDLSGRTTGQTDEKGLQTTISYSADGRTVTNTLPNGATRIEANYLDRRPKSTTGTAVVPAYYDYGIDTPSWAHPTFVLDRYRITHYGNSSSKRWLREGTDPYDNAGAWTEHPDVNDETNTIRFVKFSPQWGIVESEDQVETPYRIFGHNPYGSVHIIQQHEFDDSFGGQHLLDDFYEDRGATRNAQIDEYFSKYGGIWYSAKTNYVTQSDGSPALSFAGAQLAQLNGFQTNESSRTITFDASTNQTVVTIQIDRSAAIQRTITAVAQSSLRATNIVCNGLLVQTNSVSVPLPAIISYDDLGRTNRVQSSSGAVTAFQYNPTNGYVASVIDAFGGGTAFEYYPNGHTNAGQLKSRTAQDGKKTYSDYTPRGELLHQWGDIPYPTERKYSIFGEVTNLNTFRGSSGWTGSTWPSGNTADATYWIYDEAGGKLITKQDAQGNITSYTYFPHGGLHQRIAARLSGGVRITNTYTYSTFLDLTQIDYSDGTPSVILTDGSHSDYNRIGKPRGATDGAGTHAFSYDYSGRLASDACTSGPLSGIVVSNRYDSVFGRDRLVVSGVSASLTDDFRFDSASGRLSVVSNGVYSASYTYLPGSDAVQNESFANAGTAKMSTAFTWDYGIRMHSAGSSAGTAAVNLFTAGYDARQRRTRVGMADGSEWAYDYNDRDEVVAGKHAWVDFAPVSGQQFEYSYDTIGNRSAAKRGGDVNGANLRSISYTANLLNEYSTNTVPGYADIIGSSWASSTVTVNSSATDRKGEYFHFEASITNSSGPVWQGVTTAVGSSNVTGNVLSPPSVQSFSYDADGNLTSDGLWNYTWNAENRLSAIENLAGVPAAGRRRVEYTYDYLGRRVLKKSYSSWNGSVYLAVSTNKFVNDGWNVVAIVDGGTNVLYSFLWSSVSAQSGGGPGTDALVLVRDHAGSTAHFASSDTSGSIAALVNAADQTISAVYEYGPFGETIRATGLMAKANPFRYSSKAVENETDLVYYGFRWYNPVLGRWISRDPAGENGGLNLYGFCNNNPINRRDLLGCSSDSGLPDQVLWDIKEIISNDRDQQEMIEALTSNKIFNSSVGYAASTARLSSEVSGAGFALLKAFDALAWGALNVATGVRSQPGTMVADAEDFLVHVAHSDTAEADLDAVTLAVESGGTEEEALIVWGALTTIEDTLMK